jgi:large subunit ribosomal protein L29
MKATRLEELRSLTDDELQRREKALREALFKIRMKLATGQFSKVADVEATRRNLARVLTVMRQRQIGGHAASE